MRKMDGHDVERGHLGISSVLLIRMRKMDGHDVKSGHLGMLLG